MISESREVVTMPEDFHKIVNDFVHDIRNTFPEYNIFIDKWWKEKMDTTSSEYIFNYCYRCLHIFTYGLSRFMIFIHVCIFLK